MPTIDLQPIRVRTGSQDKEGNLALLDGELVALLVRLDDSIHGPDQGKWSVEAQFGSPRRADPFPTLADAEAWLKQQISPFAENRADDPQPASLIPLG